jgi:hypothetical protein
LKTLTSIVNHSKPGHRPLPSLKVCSHPAEDYKQREPLDSGTGLRLVSFKF